MNIIFKISQVISHYVIFKNFSHNLKFSINLEIPKRSQTLIQIYSEFETINL
jgi:hypothetical protein